jgi:hypothetical protein
MSSCISAEFALEAISKHICVKSMFPSMSISVTNTVTKYLEQQGLSYKVQCEFVEALDAIAADCQTDDDIKLRLNTLFVTANLADLLTVLGNQQGLL